MNIIRHENAQLNGYEGPHFGTAIDKLDQLIKEHECNSSLLHWVAVDLGDELFTTGSGSLDRNLIVTSDGYRGYCGIKLVGKHCTAVVLVPAILFLFFTGSSGAALGLLIWSIVFVSMADNIIGPYLISGSTHMHAFLVLLSVLGGLAAFGAVGAIAGPTILAALIALIELYKSGILRAK